MLKRFPACRALPLRQLAEFSQRPFDRPNLARSELCLNLGDGVNQAANLASSTTSIPSRNLAPLTIFGNWF